MMKAERSIQGEVANEEENTRAFTSKCVLYCEKTIPLRTNSTEYKAITAAKWLYLRDIRRRSFSQPSVKQKDRYKAEKKENPKKETEAS